MRMVDVPVVEVTNDDIVVTVPGDGSRTQANEPRPHAFYDFGSFSRDGAVHEEHVMLAVQECSCAVHDLYIDGCEACALAMFAPDLGVAPHLAKSRGIEVTP